jgi:transcription termination/antitermination factor NusG
VIHTYSGYENKVRQNLMHRIETMDVADKIFEVVVPTQDEIEIKSGQRQTVQRKVFPGYVLVKMVMDEDSWHVVRNTPGVTSFVGMGNKPTPLGDDEIQSITKAMTAEAPKSRCRSGLATRSVSWTARSAISVGPSTRSTRKKVRSRFWCPSLGAKYRLNWTSFRSSARDN